MKEYNGVYSNLKNIREQIVNYQNYQNQDYSEN